MERPEGLGWCRKVCRTLTWRAVGVSGPSESCGCERAVEDGFTVEGVGVGPSSGLGRRVGWRSP